MNLKTIAKEAGVSTATVSNVINGNYHKASQETIEKVQKIIAENHYIPNATARSLASGNSRIIGVVVPNVGEDDNFFTNLYDAYLLSLLENYIRKQGYYMMMRCVKKCSEIIPMVSSWDVSGAIFLRAFEKETEGLRSRLEFPTVFIDTYAEGQGIVNVGIDDYKGGYLSAAYLLDKGHRNIAFAGPGVNGSGVIRQRYQGFCKACEEKGVRITPEHIFQGNTRYQDGITIGRKIAGSKIPFTAVATMSDIVAFGIMEGLGLCGRRVPEDVSVIGFDDLPQCGYSTPKLTTISHKIEQKALLAGECLFKMIRGDKLISAGGKIDVEIVERQSVSSL